MNELHGITVGDKITVHQGHRTRPIEVRTVTEVKQPFVVDDQGQRWAKSGYRWGPGSLEGNPWTDARPWEPEDDILDANEATAAKRKRLIDTIRALPLEKAPIWVLEQIVQKKALIEHDEEEAP